MIFKTTTKEKILKLGHSEYTFFYQFHILINVINDPCLRLGGITPKMFTGFGGVVVYISIPNFLFNNNSSIEVR